MASNFLPRNVHFRSSGPYAEGSGEIDFGPFGKYWMPVTAVAEARIKGKPARERIAWSDYRFPESLAALDLPTARAASARNDFAVVTRLRPAYAAALVAVAVTALLSHLRPTPYNNFVLLAQALLHGHAWIDWPGAYIDALNYRRPLLRHRGAAARVPLAAVRRDFRSADESDRACSRSCRSRGRSRVGAGRAFWFARLGERMDLRVSFGRDRSVVVRDARRRLVHRARLRRLLHDARAGRARRQAARLARRRSLPPARSNRASR